MSSGFCNRWKHSDLVGPAESEGCFLGLVEKSVMRTPGNLSGRSSGSGSTVIETTKGKLEESSRVQLRPGHQFTRKHPKGTGGYGRWWHCSV